MSNEDHEALMEEQSAQAVANSQKVEYILVSDKNSKVLLSTTDYEEARKLARLIRSANGEVTVFRSLSA